MTVEQLHTANRSEITSYLEARGFAVHAVEGLEEIRTAAIMEAQLEANESGPAKLELRPTPEQLRNCTFAEVVKYLHADGMVVGAHEHEDTIREVAVRHAEDLLTIAKTEVQHISYNQGRGTRCGTARAQGNVAYTVDEANCEACLRLAAADHHIAVSERKEDARRGVGALGAQLRRAEPEYDDYYRAKAEQLVGYRATELAPWAHRAKINLIENALIEAHQAGVAQERDRPGE